MSNVLEFLCPHCGQNIRTNARYAGMNGPCPHCNKMVMVQAPAGQAEELQMPQQPRTTASTDANALVAGLIGLVGTVLLFVVFIAIQDTYVGQLFTSRGPIPYVATFVTTWGLAILVLKFIAVKREVSFAEKELDLMPLEAGMQITPSNVDQFLQHLDGLPEQARNSILGQRIHGALEHFRSRNSVPEVQAYLSSHSEIDASKVDSGYTLLRAFIWAVPILGFIGTVMGISSAVTGLAGSLDSATEQTASVDNAPDNNAVEAEAESSSTGSKMIQAMGLVTQGLSTAFDTTFLALVMAIILLFPTETLKRIEYGMLDRIEAFTNESLLRRMSDSEGEDQLLPEMAKLLEPVFRRHQQWLIEWQDNVAKLGEVIGQNFESHAARIQQELKQVDSGHAERISQLVESLTTVIRDMNQAVTQLNDVGGQVAGDLRSTVTTSTELQEMLADNTGNMAQLASQWSEIRSTPATSNGNGRLEQVLDSLNENIVRLAEAAQLTDGTNDGGGRKSRGWLFGKG